MAVSVVRSQIILVRLPGKYPLCGCLFDLIHLNWVILKQMPIKRSCGQLGFSSYISWKCKSANRLGAVRVKSLTRAELVNSVNFSLEVGEAKPM